MDSSARRLAWSAGAAFFLLLVLALHLFSALLAATAAYVLYRRLWHLFAPLRPDALKAVLALLLTIVVLTALVLALAQAVRGLWVPHGGLPGLLQVLADALDRLRADLPPWVTARWPESADDLQRFIAQWLREHAASLQHWGQEALRMAAHVFVGAAVGLLAAFRRGPVLPQSWARGVRPPLANYVAAFGDVVSAQVRIAGANTALTAVLLLIALPLAGVHLPASHALVLFTFFAGLVPIVGNLASNAAILLVAGSVSGGVALVALIYLIAIHKLEYVLNAHFVGQRTQVPAPVLLGSMLLFEAMFGLGGLLAAPIYVAWAFRELDELNGSPDAAT